MNSLSTEDESRLVMHQCMSECYQYLRVKLDPSSCHKLNAQKCFEEIN